MQKNLETVFVSATLVSISDTSKKTQKINLNWVFSIYYLVQFQRGKKVVWALINFSSKVNSIIRAYAFNLDLRVWQTVVGAPKIKISLL